MKIGNSQRARKHRDLRDESGRILIWAAVGIILTALVVLSLVVIARLHLLRTELADLTDTAVLAAITQVENAPYYEQSLVTTENSAVHSVQHLQLHLNEAKARNSVNAAITNQLALNPQTAATLRDIQIKSLWIDEHNKLHLQLAARAVVTDLVPGYARVSVTLESSSVASLLSRS